MSRNTIHQAAAYIAHKQAQREQFHKRLFPVLLAVLAVVLYLGAKVIW